MVYEPIGIIFTPFETVENTPIQPRYSKNAQGHIEIFPEFAEGLKDLDGFSHLILLYHLHLVSETKLTVVPFKDTQQRGVFATRAPVRPNPIGLSTVRLKEIQENRIYFDRADMVNGTPLLYIKPCVVDFDRNEPTKCGWLEGKTSGTKNHTADDRFTE